MRWLRIDLIEIDPFRNEMELFVLEKIEKNGRVNLCLKKEMKMKKNKRLY
jgi:hypothetical protein